MNLTFSFIYLTCKYLQNAYSISDIVLAVSWERERQDEAKDARRKKVFWGFWARSDRLSFTPKRNPLIAFAHCEPLGPKQEDSVEFGSSERTRYRRLPPGLGTCWAVGTLRPTSVVPFQRSFMRNLLGECTESPKANVAIPEALDLSPILLQLQNMHSDCKHLKMSSMSTKWFL